MIKKLLDSRWFYYGAALLLVAIFFATQVKVQLPARSFGPVEDIATLKDRKDLNVVFILVDTLRADHLGSYGYERETSPVMDRLAATGIRLANNIAQSTWTKSSMASIWTGTYPVTNEVLRYQHAIPEVVTMPAELLKAAGYRTVGLYRNGWVGHEFGFGQGFERYLRPQTAQTVDAVERARHTPFQLVGNDWDLTSSATQFLEQYRDEKFFLYLHYMDVHQYAYEAESALFGTNFADAYDNAIHWTDRNIEAVVAKLEELGLMDNTLLVIAADHGEAFREHGSEGHAKDLYGEVVRTPVIIVLPWFLDGGLVVDDLTENVDLMPTILDMIGIDPVDETDGASLVPLFLGGPDPHPGPAYAHLDRNWAGGDDEQPIVAIRTEDRKFIWKKDWTPPTIELYDVEADPGEKINIASEQEAEVQEFLEMARAYYDHAPGSWNASPDAIEIDDLKLGILKALGYVIQDE